MKLIQTDFEKAGKEIWKTKHGKVILKRLGKPFSYSVKKLPRQWPIGFIYIATNRRSSGIPASLTLGIAWNLFYIQDDLIDKKNKRYGKKTAYSVYGEYKCKSTFNKCLNQEAANQNNIVDQIINDARAILLRLAVLQDERQKGFSSIQEYSNNSVERLMFIRNCWYNAAVQSGDIELAKVIKDTSHLSLLTAQLRNDLKNTDKRETIQGNQQFSDFIENKTTFVTLPVIENSTIEEKSKIKSISVPLAKSDLLFLQYLCNKYGTLKNIRQKILENILILERIGKTSSMSDRQKEVWSIYIQQTFKNNVIE